MRLLCLAFVFALSVSSLAAQPLDTTPRIAIISAFDPEINILRNRLKSSQSFELIGREFSIGELSGKPVVVFSSGVSMVNAAMSTQLALDHFEIEGIVVSGVAGGADPALNVGDIAVPSQWGQYLEMAYARQTEDGFKLPPFLSSDFPNFGMMFTINIGVFEELAGDGKSRFWFPVHADYLDAAQKAAGQVKLSGTDSDGRTLEKTPQIHVGGGGVSGTAFVDNAKFREWTHNTFDARVLDMETAAIAQVADANGVPFLAFRALSDLAGGESGVNQFDVFISVSQTNLANFVEAFLENIK